MYKRQVVLEPSARLVGERIAQKIILPVPALQPLRIIPEEHFILGAAAHHQQVSHGHAAVSYTHLDVYKRQLEMHETHKGKVGIVSKVEVATRDDLSTAYTCLLYTSRCV